MITGLFLISGIECTAQVTIPSGGVYWTEFNNIPDSAYQVGGQTFGTHCIVKRLSIGEPSTSELMADLEFPDGINCVTYKNPNDKVQYWVERTQDATGKTIALKVASTAANIPYLNLIMYSSNAASISELFIYGLKPDGNVVHFPDGSVSSNPYDDPLLKFGGAKQIGFRVKDWKKSEKARRILEEAGYETSSGRYENDIYNFIVTSTQDGRAKIEKDVLKKKYWFPIKEYTEGNRGLYELCDTLTLNIESHKDGDNSKSQKITLRGSFFNPAGEFDKVTDILIGLSSGPESKRFHSTITGDSTFTAELDLYPGLNMLVFIPLHISSSGKEVNYTKYSIKAQDERIEALNLTYDAGWKGKITISQTTTRTTDEPFNSESVSIKTFSANLNINFTSSMLWYIQKSHANAKTCADFDNCELFFGTEDGNITVSVESQTKTKGCDDNLPLKITEKSKGSGTTDNYKLSISASLTPWESDNASTERHYHLNINAEPKSAINTNLEGSTITSQYFDCSLNQWISHSGGLQAVIRLDKLEPILKFPDPNELEDYSKSPVTSKSWSFAGTQKYDDGYSKTVKEYTATLTIHP